MFTDLARLVVRRRRAVLASSLLLLIVSGAVGIGVFGRLRTGGFVDPESESARAEALLADQFGGSSPDLLLLLSVDGAGDSAGPDEGLPVDRADVAAEGAALTRELAQQEGVSDVASYWSLGGAPPLRSEAGDKALILISIPGDDDDDERAALVEELIDTYDTTRGPLTVEVGGVERVFAQISETIEGDLARAESIAVPLTLALLIIVFGGILAALLPVAVGAASVLCTFLVLFAVTAFTDVSVFSINLVTAMGLGMAIDYSLFVVTRFREELANGRSVEDAVIRTVETAGRTVAFSGLTVAISLAALLVFPLYFLRSFAYAGIGVILVAMITSVVSLPALLAVLGPGVDRWRVLPRRQSRAGGGPWHRVAAGVMRRPVLVAVASTAFLVALGVPFLGVEFGVPDDRVLPEGDPARVVADVVRDEFASDESNGFAVVVTGEHDDQALAGYAGRLSAVAGVARVDAPTGRYAGGQEVAPVDPSLAALSAGTATRLNVVPSVEPISPEAEEMVAAIRQLDHPFEDVAVGGASASLVDSKAAIFEVVPLAGAIIIVATFVLLFMMFGSVLVPLKAIVLNTLSLTASFGAMVWVFQDGNGAGLLGFTATGLTDTTMPILMFCVAFGLSMDYEVFLLSRIKEEHDRTGDNELSVAVGLEKTGRLVTAAALLLSITFFAFATSGVTFIKLMGLGLGLAVLVDAFIVRATLVPALMKLAGEWNWWAPAPLRRLHDRIGISEVEPEPPQGDDGLPGPGEPAVTTTR